MDKKTIGYVQVDGDLRQLIRMGSTWRTSSGQVVSLATSRPMLETAATLPARGTDNSIGILEFTLPLTGRGDGTIVHAVRVAFDDDGRIVARTQALKSGIERVTNVEVDTREESGESVAPPSGQTAP
jgi:hypothetical protein